MNKARLDRLKAILLDTYKVILIPYAREIKDGEPPKETNISVEELLELINSHNVVLEE